VVTNTAITIFVRARNSVRDGVRVGVAPIVTVYSAVYSTW